MTKSCVSCTLRPQSNKQGSLPSCEAFVLPELRVELVLSQGAPPPLSLLGQVRLGHTPPPQLFEQSRRRPLQLPAIMSVTSACKQYCKSLYDGLRWFHSNTWRRSRGLFFCSGLLPFPDLLVALYRLDADRH